MNVKECNGTVAKKMSVGMNAHSHTIRMGAEMCEKRKFTDYHSFFGLLWIETKKHNFALLHCESNRSDSVSRVKLSSFLNSKSHKN